ncbi:Arrestin domain-containing protein 2 [Podila humilis]|nr:Arrestin domain-containing protein 2 [Podila humilis]
MNYFFTSSSSTSSHGNNTSLTCNTNLPAAVSSLDPRSASSVSPLTPPQDLELVIEIESSFHGVLLGMPEECPGAVLNATAILHVRKKPIRASKLVATFDGRIKVQCNDGATFGPEQYRERVLAHKDWVLWQAGSNTAPGASKNHIPVGTHYYPLSIQLDGALPPSFSGKHGSIRYMLSSTLYRPLFHSDLNSVQEIEIKRCLVNESSAGVNAASRSQTRTNRQDLGAMFLDQLSRAGVVNLLNTPLQLNSLDMGEAPTGPTTITHHNTYKELLRYTASSPPIAHLEGGIIQIDLTLEPLPPSSYIYSIAYGLKECIHYRTSATGSVTDNKSEILYPIGQQTVIIPRDQERERSMSSAGAGASTRQLLELRACPLLTNVDTLTPLIEVQHRITCNVVIVLPDNVQRRNTVSSGSRSAHGFGRRDHQQEYSTGTTSGGGGGILRRLNLAPQPLAPILNLVDSTGADVTNNAVLLGEVTQSIIEPALTPANVELNDAPPLPSSTRIENIVLELPIILTSRFPLALKEQSYEPVVAPVGVAAANTLFSASVDRDLLQSNSDVFNEDSVNTPLIANNTSEPTPVVLQFVHNQEIAPTVIPTTGTTIHIAPTHEQGNFSLSTSRSLSSSASATTNDQESRPSSSTSSPMTLSNSNTTFPSTIGSPLVPIQSGISAGLRAAAAASLGSPLSAVHGDGTRPTLSRPPSYERRNIVQPQEAPPKYEDLTEPVDPAVHSGLGISIPRSTRSPVVTANSSPGAYAFSSQQHEHATSYSQSPVPHESILRDCVLASSPQRSSTSSSTGNCASINREGQGSSPCMIRGHTRSGSSMAMQHPTSAAHSQSTSALFMTPMAHSPSSLQRQQQHDRHQRQRSVGAATMIGSLGRNGGYLSQQPSSLTMTNCMIPTAVTSLDRQASPPAYRAT